MMDKDIFQVIEIDSWNALEKEMRNLHPSYIFRGQNNSEWNLQTTIERTSVTNKKRAERFMISEFKKNIYNHNISRVPNNNLEILFHLQHFGAPTRLIDFTESPYVASFFALNESHKGYSSIYAVHTFDLFGRISTFADDYFHKFFDRKNTPPNSISSKLNKPNVFQELFLSNSNQVKFVAQVKPHLHHERSNPQASTHLAIGNIKASFLQNLNNLIQSSDPVTEIDKPYLKFVFPNKIRESALYDLKMMNINYSSLFPDFAGFIKNLFFDYECYKTQEKFAFIKAYEKFYKKGE